VFTAREPDERRLLGALWAMRDAPFTYAEPGATRGRAPAGYALDERAVEVGRGPAAFAAARAALLAWRAHESGWTRLVPRDRPPEPGLVVATLARLGPLWSVNPCRVVYVEDAPGRYAFAYGTLRGHAARGEERFAVEALDDGRVVFTLRAFSRPAGPLLALGRPAARLVQARAALTYVAAMRRAVRGSPP
jgi:uncharacterized protein (UPF0548 family)